MSSTSQGILLRENFNNQVARIRKKVVIIDTKKINDATKFIWLNST